jgi:predicted GNAT superfamily acetyltransferase
MNIRLLETPAELTAVEELQKLVWPGDDTEIVPVHMLLAALHGGGLVIGAYDGELLAGFVFGFPGVDHTPQGLQYRHCSHMAAVHPDYRDTGLGFKLKRAQWQMVRRQGFERITWTYDPLQSRNANLNIAKLGAVCNTYLPNYYGELRDGLNLGLPTDRFQVDWWVNSSRVRRRLSKQPRKRLDLAHYLSAETPRLNETHINDQGLVTPCPTDLSVSPGLSIPLLLLEIPADFLTLKETDADLALTWRQHTCALFEQTFTSGYLVTDFVYLPGSQPRSFYVLSHGESTL